MAEKCKDCGCLLEECVCLKPSDCIDGYGLNVSQYAQWIELEGFKKACSMIFGEDDFKKIKFPETQEKFNVLKYCEGNPFKNLGELYLRLAVCFDERSKDWFVYKESKSGSIYFYAPNYFPWVPHTPVSVHAISSIFGEVMNCLWGICDEYWPLLEDLEVDVQGSWNFCFCYGISLDELEGHIDFKKFKKTCRKCVEKNSWSDLSFPKNEKDFDLSKNLGGAGNLFRNIGEVFWFAQRCATNNPICNEEVLDWFYCEGEYYFGYPTGLCDYVPEYKEQIKDAIVEVVQGFTNLDVEYIKNVLIKERLLFGEYCYAGYIE